MTNTENEHEGIKIIDLWPYVIFFLGLITFLMIFFEALYTMFTLLGTTTKVASYTGLDVAFGYKSEDNVILGFSFLALLGYILPLASGLIALIKIKYFEIIKFFGLGVLFVVSSILLFTLTSYIDIYLTLGQTVEMGVFPIIAGVLSVIAALTCFYYSLKIKL